jgi:hypothetical protein
MINPTNIECYWMVHAEGEAAEYVASSFSLSSMNDIKEAVLISNDYSNDIQATVSLDETLTLMKAQLPSEVIEHSMLNPLYMPSTPEQIDQVMGESPDENMMAFTGMDGSPFTIKTVGVSLNEREILSAKLSWRPFDLPTYSDIIREQANLKLN